MVLHKSSSRVSYIKRRMEDSICKIFCWTEVTISEEYINTLPMESSYEKYCFLKEIASATEVKIGKDERGVQYQGLWSHILKAKEKLEDFLIILDTDMQEECAETNKAKEMDRDKPVDVTAVSDSNMFHEHEIYVDIKLSSDSMLQSNTNALSKIADIELSEPLPEDLVDESWKRNKSKVVSSDYDVRGENSNSDKENLMCESVRADEAKTSDQESLTSLFDVVEKAEKPKKSEKWRKYEKLAPFKYFCSLCSFKTKRQSHYESHKKIHSRKTQVYKCEHCDFSTLGRGHLRIHEVTHSVTKYSCNHCSYRTNLTNLLLRHQKLKHKNKMIKQKTTESQILSCSDCSYTTKKMHLLKRHMKSHSSNRFDVDEIFNCAQCSYRTKRKEHYVRHVNNVHWNKRPYLCDYCGKAFKRHDALKQHSVTHPEIISELTVYCCSACGKLFRSQSQLNQHEFVHTNVRSFLCEICGASFKTLSIQRKHVQTIHYNPRSFTCDACFKKFNTKYALGRHYNKQHREQENLEQSSNLQETETKTVQDIDSHVQDSSSLQEIATNDQFINVEVDPSITTVITSDDVGEIFISSELDTEDPILITDSPDGKNSPLSVKVIEYAMERF